jgi:hypothetical protein
MKRVCKICIKEHQFIESAPANYEVVGVANNDASSM